jgi:hypothetical protein
LKLTDQYREAAREAATRAPESRKPRQLDQLFPENVFPTAEQFQAVYNVTGKTERERLGRITVKGASPSAATESAWCRYQLRRWALKSLVTTEAGE